MYAYQILYASVFPYMVIILYSRWLSVMMQKYDAQFVTGVATKLLQKFWLLENITTSVLIHCIIQNINYYIIHKSDYIPVMCKWLAALI